MTAETIFQPRYFGMGSMGKNQAGLCARNTVFPCCKLFSSVWENKTIVIPVACSRREIDLAIVSPYGTYAKLRCMAPPALGCVAFDIELLAAMLDMAAFALISLASVNL